jgi:hypothetical protein
VTANADRYVRHPRGFLVANLDLIHGRGDKLLLGTVREDGVANTSQIAGLDLARILDGNEGSRRAGIQHHLNARAAVDTAPNVDRVVLVDGGDLDLTDGGGGFRRFRYVFLRRNV